MKRSLSTVAALALMATTASAETRYATITNIKTNYQEITTNQPVNICSDVEVPIYGNTGGGASGGDVLTGMIIGGLLGKGATGKDNGAAAGAVIGGIIAADQNKGQRVITGYRVERQCRQENRYTTQRKVKNYRITYEWDGVRASSYTYNRYNVGDRIPVSVSIVAQ